MKGGLRVGRNRRFQGCRRKVCIVCGKHFTADEDKNDTKLPITEEETDLFVDEAGCFSCGNHRRDQVCHDCFQDMVIEGHLANVDHLENLEFRQDMDHAVKRMWKKIYLKKGDRVPWSDDDEEDEVPSDDVQRSKEKASSSSLSGNKKCAHCGKVGNLSRCAKRKVSFYCSRSHQAADYAKHKAHYQAPKTPVNDTAQPTPKTPVSHTAQPTETKRDEKPLDALNSSEQPPFSSAKACGHCGKTNNLSMCSRCKMKLLLQRPSSG